MVRDQVPKYGWKAKMDYVFPETRRQKVTSNFHQFLQMLPCGIRYAIYWVKMFIKGIPPIMDYVKLINDEGKSGVPIGGIGGGTIGRGFKGEFYRYQMIPGMYEYHTVEANQFIVTIKNKDNETVYQKVLSCQGKPMKKHLNTWEWNFPASDAEYTALYPRAWSVFNIKEHGIKLVCRQISPVIPNNYKDSCVPGAVFEWTIENNSSETKFVSITFTFKNGTGAKTDAKGAVSTSPFLKKSELGSVKGVTLEQTIGGLPCTYNISGQQSLLTTVSHCCYFNPNGSGVELWDSLFKTGELMNDSAAYQNHQEVGMAVCCKTVVDSKNTGSVSFSLCWDCPIVRFMGSKRNHKRYYTKYFGDDGKAGPVMCAYSLANYNRWDLWIDEWQSDILNDSDLPDWYKNVIFNELYYVSDGGTVWLLMGDDELGMLEENDPRREYGRFAWLEGHEYRMYNTYDVHFYASISLAMHWPKLQLSVQYDFRDSVDMEDKTIVWFWYNGARDYRKKKNSVPHDLGDPAEDPFIKINGYPVHDVSEWRDLNSKFVLQVYRDYILMKDLQYLKHMFPQCETIMKESLKFDLDNDGLIENSGSPDQTYDSWIMKGASAYCGGLWLSAVLVFIKIAAILGKTELVSQFDDILERGKKAFESKLWNGKYFTFDEVQPSIMADQLCGLWYLHCCNIDEEVFNKSHVRSSLETIYEFNVKKYYNGTQGAVNGMLYTGEQDRESVQSEECWIGVTNALSSLFIFEGMVEEGFNTIKGLYHGLYMINGLAFAIPEALHKRDLYRAVGYMRPLSIWSTYLAYQRRKQLKEPNSSI